LGALWRRNKKEAAETKQQVIELFPRLGERLEQRADTLVRRRTSDAGHWSRLDVEATTPSLG